MTREQNIRAILECVFSQSRNDLIDIAVNGIMTLKDEPCEDAISREDAYKIVMMPDTPNGKHKGTLIRELPPVTPSKQWISVSKRLPEEETDVLICNENGDIELSRGSYSTEVESDFIWYTSGWHFGEVVAWMPLPKPYERKKNI